MNKKLLQIDVSKFKNETEEEDLIKIKLDKEDIVTVNFSKLVNKSKYIRDKYKYSEAINAIQLEIDYISKENDINSESIKEFIELIQEEKVSIPIEHYKDLYTISEYFNISKFTENLDKISEEELFNDLDFTIQLLIDSTRSSKENENETQLKNKIEKYLSERINECIFNCKFKELDISTIYRIFEGKDKYELNHNLLIDFILESISIRFIFLKFVELDQMSDEKIEQFFKFMMKEEEESRRKYLEYMPFNLLFIQRIKNNYDKLLKTFNETKEELNQTKNEMKQTNEDFNKLKDDLNQNKEELKQTKNDLNQVKEELNQTKEEMKQTKKDFDKMKDDLNQENEEFEKRRGEIEQKETKQHSLSIIVGGYDCYNQLGQQPNNKNKSNKQIIFPPQNFPFDPSSILSYSIYLCHSVLVTKDGILMGIGNNVDGRISSSLTKAEISQFTEFSINDSDGHQLIPISAVCTNYSTLYMLSKSNVNKRQLVYCSSDINGGDPIFLDIGNKQPVALFGGCYHAAAICSEGEVIFINRYSVKKSPMSLIDAVSLPDGEKASSVACCSDMVVVLSSNGRVFSSSIEKESCILKFSASEELAGVEIVCVSGAYSHCLAVSKEGRTFGRGSNSSGKLGVGKRIKSVSSFTEISSLLGYKIKAAYAGDRHSLFQTQEGKILSCGNNEYRELFLSIDQSGNVYLPVETMITGGVSFCIAGHFLSVVFIGEDPPLNSPNIRIKYHP